MPGLFGGRRSLIVRPDVDLSSSSSTTTGDGEHNDKRSSSLPPEAADDSSSASNNAPALSASASSGIRGRSVNPIGPSCQSSGFHDDSDANNNNNANSGGEVAEPGWFAHAFHGSEGCTCGREHEAGACDEEEGDGGGDGDNDADNTDNGSDDNGSDANDCEADGNVSVGGDGSAATGIGGPRSDRSEEVAVNKRTDGYDAEGGASTESTAAVESELSGSGTSCSSSRSGNSTESGISSASKGADKENNGDGGGVGGSTSTPTSSSPLETLIMSKGSTEKELDYLEDAISESYDHSTITSYNTSFTAQNQSIQSDLLKDNNGDYEESTQLLSSQTTGYDPKSHRSNSSDTANVTANNVRHRQENNDVSSITVGSYNHPSSSNAAAASSKSCKSKTSNASRVTANVRHRQDNDVSSITMDDPYNNNNPSATSNNNAPIIIAPGAGIATKRSKSKSFVTNVKKNTYDKIKKKGKSKSFRHQHQTTATRGNNNGSLEELDQSIESSLNDNSIESVSTNGTGGSEKRRRGRSLGLKKMGRRGKQSNTDAAALSNSLVTMKGNPHPYQDDNTNNTAQSKARTKSRGRGRLSSRSKARDERQQQQGDHKTRERSRSIVKDAMSFIESIDRGRDIKKEERIAGKEERQGTPPSGKGSIHSSGARRVARGLDSGGDGDSVATEESRSRSVTSHSSTVVTGSSHTGGGSSAPSRNDRSSTSNHGGVYLRNKFKEEQTLQELHAIMHRRSSDSSGSTSHNNNNNIDFFDKSEKTLQLLSSLQETNHQNESTIRNLQEQLNDLTNERNAFRNNSERMMEIMTKQKSQLEKELKKERKGFADVSHSHKREIEEWRSKARKSERRCKRTEYEKLQKSKEKEVVESSKSVGREHQTMRSTEELAVAIGLERSSFDNGQTFGEEASLLASILGIDMSRATSTRNDDATTTTQDERNLYAAILKLSEMESEYATQAQDLQKENEHIKSQAQDYKEKHDVLDQRHQRLLLERDDETAMVNALENKLEGCRLVIETMKRQHEEELAESTASSMVNDELVEKIGELADENGQLLQKCQKLESRSGTSEADAEAHFRLLVQDLEAAKERNEEAQGRIEALTVENRNLRVSFMNHGKKSKQMKGLVRSLRSSLNTEDEYSDLEEEEEDSDGSRNNNKSGTPMTEMEHEEALSMIEDMQLENDSLHASMEEAIQMAGGFHEKMANFTSKHEGSVREYEDKLVGLTEELEDARLFKEELGSKLEALRKENAVLSADLEQANSLVVCSVHDEIRQEQLSRESRNREKRELSSAMESLKTDNEKLHKSMQEMTSLVATAEECVGKLSEENVGLKDAQEYYEQQLQEMTVEKEANQYLREEIKIVSTEREEAYDACKVLQQEINLLRQKVKEARGRVEMLSSDNGSSTSSSVDYQEKLAELTKANESLVKELEQKNEALQAVQSALESLKTEQSAIKETIVQLRTENAKLLRDSPPPMATPTNKSILKQQRAVMGGGNSVSSADSSAIQRLESRIKKVEKENKGLREANATLSAKLFDEMEKTDALRVANEGLAARICKLVAFIQQQNLNGNGSGGGGGDNGAGGGGANASNSSGNNNNNGNGGSSKRSTSLSRRNKSPAPPKKRK